MLSQARTFADSFVWGFLIVFFAPTTLIVASWKAVPGDAFFPVKIGVEKTALFIISPSSLASGSLQIRYTERRLAEAQTLMAIRQSVTGLTYFEKQMKETTDVIIHTKDPKIRGQLTREYKETLANMSVTLAKERAQIVARASNPTTTQNTQPSGGSNTAYIPNADYPTAQGNSTNINPRVTPRVAASAPVTQQALPPPVPQANQLAELYQKFFGGKIPTPTSATTRVVGTPPQGSKPSTTTSTQPSAGFQAAAEPGNSGSDNNQEQQQNNSGAVSKPATSETNNTYVYNEYREDVGAVSVVVQESAQAESQIRYESMKMEQLEEADKYYEENPNISGDRASFDTPTDEGGIENNLDSNLDLYGDQGTI